MGVQPGAVDSGLRIGLICHRGVGGSARVAVELAGQLAMRGHEVHLFARSRPFGLPLQSRVTVHVLEACTRACPRLDTDWDEASVGRLVELIAAVPLDVLHFHYALPFARVAATVRARLGRAAPAVIGTLHGTDVSVHARRPPVAASLRADLAAADHITAVSRDHAELAQILLDLPVAPAVVPNGIDLARFVPVAPSGPRRPRVAHVSNLRAVKRPEAMAEIFARVRQDVDAELWLVGDGEGLPGIRATLAAAGHAADLVTFGLRDDLEQILPHTDVLLVTSRTESFCLVALEAAACGIPVVAPRVGGLPEVVRDGVTGLLHEPGDDEAAAALLRGLLTDDVQRGRLGAAAVARAVELSHEAVIPTWETLYRDVASLPTTVLEAA